MGHDDNNLNSLAAHFPDDEGTKSLSRKDRKRLRQQQQAQSNEEPALILDSSSESEQPKPPTQEHHEDTPAEPPENEIAPHVDHAVAGMPDVGGGRGDHLVVQGLITFRADLLEFILAPWQVLPFSAGFEFEGRQHGITYHRGVYQVDMRGDPVPDGRNQRIAFARGAHNYSTPADSICGFSGTKFRKTSVTVAAAECVRDDWSRRSLSEHPWAATVENMMPGIDEILPKFWVEYEETDVAPEAPFETKFDLATGRRIRLVPIDNWHLLAPVPGIASGFVDDCKKEHGARFWNNRIWISGTGLRRTTYMITDAAPILSTTVASVNSSIKLKSVLLPCVNHQSGGNERGNAGHSPVKSEGGLHDLFSSPSVNALRNLLGHQVVPGGSVFAQ